MTKINTQTTLLLSFALFTAFCPHLQAGTHPPEPEGLSQTLQPKEIPQGLTATEWGSIQQQIQQHRYHPHADDQGGYRAANPAHGWNIHYASDGITTLTPSQPVAPSYQLGIQLTGIGYHKLQTLNKPQSVQQQDFTVSYQWNNNLREWWVNSQQQLEQWFIVKQKPKGHEAQQPLTLQMQLHSDLQAQLDGNTLYFTDDAGTSISYNKLKVWDDRGTEMPAHMQLAGNTLSLHIDDSSAQYPLTIDPSFQQQAYLKASNTDAFDHFGFSVALSGDTLVVGAFDEDSNSTGVNGDESDNSASRSGAAYVFTRSGTVWNQQAYLKASNTDAGDFFGRSVALSGDTLVVGAFGEDSNSTGVNGDESDNSAINAGAAYVFSVIEPHVLPHNQWHQISLPMDPKSTNTVDDIFGDDGLGSYDTDWVLYYYDTNTDAYVKPALSDTLAQGVGYWIIQTTGIDKTLEMPVGSATTPTVSSTFGISLGTESGANQWNMIGYPFGLSLTMGSSRIITDAPSTCDTGCTVDDAETEGVFQNQLWNFNGTAYDIIEDTDKLEPWLGYWGASLNNADGQSPVFSIPDSE